MTGKAAMTKPAQHLPAHTPAGHADGQCGFGAEGLPPTVACGVWTTHQTVDHLGRSRQCPQMMIAVVADMHGTVTARTRALLDIKIDPCEDGPCWPTIRHSGSTLALTLVDGSRRVPTITYSKHLEAIRKLFCTAATRSSSILAVMKLGATAGGESVEHKMYMTDLDHSSTGCYTALIVLAVPTVPAMPGVRPLNHPAFFQRREIGRARRTHRHFDVPAGPMLGHPGVKGVIVILLIRKDRDETRKVVRCDGAEQERGRHPIIETSTGNEDGKQQAQRIDQQMPLASFDVLAPIIAALGAPHFGGLDRLAIDACGTGGMLAPRFHAGSFAQGLHHLGPCLVVAPLGKVVIDGTCGQQIMRQHIPLAATSVQVEQCIQDFPQVYLPRAPSLCVLLGGWDHRFHNRPLLVRQI